MGGNVQKKGRSSTPGAPRLEVRTSLLYIIFACQHPQSRKLEKALWCIMWFNIGGGGGGGPAAGVTL